jgi:hypothetical protein
MADVRIINEGTLTGVLALNAEARQWIDDNVHSEGWQWMGKVLWVDHRMVDNLLDGMIAAGLSLTD